MTRRLTIRGLKQGYKYNGYGEYVFEGDFDFEVEDLGTYVQVGFFGDGRRFTYRDPAGDLSTLKVDDYVEVPFGEGGTRVGRVVEFGRGSYTGPVKDIANKLIRSVSYQGRVSRARRNGR